MIVRGMSPSGGLLRRHDSKGRAHLHCGICDAMIVKGNRRRPPPSAPGGAPQRGHAPCIGRGAGYLAHQRPLGAQKNPHTDAAKRLTAAGDGETVSGVRAVLQGIRCLAGVGAVLTRPLLSPPDAPPRTNNPGL